MMSNGFYRFWKSGFEVMAVQLCSLCVAFTAVGASSDDLSEAVGVLEVNFEDPRSTKKEQHGAVALRAKFSKPFYGSLNYSIDGTADQKTDFDSPDILENQKYSVATGGSVDEINIVINLRDDESVEDIETIRVSLEPGEGYAIGPNNLHTVSIFDNDESWQVVHDVDGMLFEYGMQVIRNDGTTTSTAISDGRSGLPAGTYVAELIALDDDRFEAKIGPIEVEADMTLLGVNLSRTFTLKADRSIEGHNLENEQLVAGSVTETWTSAAEDASHLTRSGHIFGEFVMRRTLADFSANGWREDAVNSLSYSKCEDAYNFAENAETNKITAKLGTIPYHGFVEDTLEEVRSLLYWDNEAEEKVNNAAAFRYKALLYKKEKVEADSYIRAQFENIDNYWGCEERGRAFQAAEIVLDSLTYAPWDRNLRRILLDIYYDIAVAEKILAQNKHVEVAESMVSSQWEAGEVVINKEIAILEETLPLYRHALTGFMRLMQASFGIDVADTFGTFSQPYGYYIFRKEQPSRSPYATVFKTNNGEWVLPSNGNERQERSPIFEGYKDVTLLFELIRDYLRTAEQLSRRYIMRGESFDLDRAEDLIASTLLVTYLEGHALLAMFPEILEENAIVDARSGLKEAVTGWRHSYTSLGQLRRVIRGDGNILGFPTNFLALTQTGIEGENSFFHSYDFFYDFLVEKPNSPLKNAIQDFDDAKKNKEAYEMRSDRLADEFVNREEQYDLTLNRIQNEVSEQEKRILLTENLVAQNGQEISNLIERINEKVILREKQKEINNAISLIYLDYGSEEATLIEEIAEINARQVYWNNEAQKRSQWLIALSPQPQHVESRRKPAFGS